MGYGENLKKYLKEKGIKVTHLAEKTGIPATTLYSMLRRDSSPSVAVGILISEALGLTNEEIAFGEFTEPEPPRQIASVEIYVDGKEVSMKHAMTVESEQEQIYTVTYLAKALLDVCEDMDTEHPEALAIKSLMIASTLKDEDMKIRKGEETLPC